MYKCKFVMLYNKLIINKGTIDDLSQILTTRTRLSRGGFEFRLPNGQGVRYNANGEFSGFLDPKN